MDNISLCCINFEAVEVFVILILANLRIICCEDFLVKTRIVWHCNYIIVYIINSLVRVMSLYYIYSFIFSMKMASKNRNMSL